MVLWKSLSAPLSTVCHPRLRRVGRPWFNRAVRQGLFTGEPKQSLTTPDADDVHPFGLAPIDEAKRRVNQLTQVRRVKLRHHAAKIWMIRQVLDVFEQLGDEAFSHLRDTLLTIIAPEVPQVVQR